MHFDKLSIAFAFWSNHTVSVVLYLFIYYSWHFGSSLISLLPCGTINIKTFHWKMSYNSLIHSHIHKKFICWVNYLLQNKLIVKLDGKLNCGWKCFSITLFFLGYFFLIVSPQIKKQLQQIKESVAV